MVSNIYIKVRVEIFYTQDLVCGKLYLTDISKFLLLNVQFLLFKK